MAIVVTENWSARTLSLKKPWTAQREFVVTGVTTELDALVAVDTVNPTRAIPQRGDGHPLNPTRLKCEGPTAKSPQGPVYWEVSCPYAEGDFTDDAADPLDETTKITWRTITITEPLDMDLDGRPILNTAGGPQGTVPQVINFKELRLIKNLPFYDIGLSETYENAVNSAAVDLSGVTLVKVEHMRCVTIEPAIQDFTSDVPYMPMAFTFHVMLSDVLGPHPFQHRVFDQGREGWYSASGTKHSARFNMNGEPTDIDIRLNGAGIPLTAPYPSTAIKVGDAAAAPTSPPQAISTYAKEFYDASGNALGSATAACASVILIYKAAKVVDFAPLTSIF